MSCEPSFSYRPQNFVPGEAPCFLPAYHEHRARLTDGNTFFRTLVQSKDQNNISLALTLTTLEVWYKEQLEETFPATMGSGSIQALRNIVNASSKFIEMPLLGVDVFDTRTDEDDTLMGGLEPFPRTYMTGGDGGPTDGSSLAAIRTGPERSLIIIATTEDYNGNPVVKPYNQRIYQWSGASWIPYYNVFFGTCPPG